MFGRGVRLFRLLGFEVRLDWSWLIIAALVIWSLAGAVFPSYVEGLSLGTYWWMAVVGAAGLFLSIVLHELGHSLVARGFGIPMTGITLFVFGGVAEMGGEPPSPAAEFFMAIAGPLTSVFLAGVAWGIRHLNDAVAGPIEVTAIFFYLSWMNVVLAAFNIIPAFPLDGGRVLRSILWALSKNLLRATRIAAAVGTGFALLLMAWGIVSLFFGNFFLAVWWIVIGLFIRGASRMSYRQVLLQDALAGQPVSRFLDLHPVTVSPATTVRELVDNYVYRSQAKSFPIVSDGHLIGCVTVDQVRQVPRARWDQITLGNLAAACARGRIIPPETDAASAVTTMTRLNTNRLMVVDHDRFLGTVSLTEIMNFLGRKLEFERAG